jgi:hypothetical protein
MRIIYCAVFFLLILPFAFAEQESPAYEKFPSAVGVCSEHVGLSGGLQYQHWFGPTGIQMRGGVKYNTGGDLMGRTMDVWIASEIQYRVYGQRYTNWLTGQFYLWGAFGYHGYITQKYIYPISGTVGTMITSPYVNAAFGGIGLGLEIILFDRLSVPIEFGNIGEYPFNYEQPYMGFYPSIGLCYRF